MDPAKHAAGRYDTVMRKAVVDFQQKHTLIEQADLKRSTLEALARPLLENDFAALQRVLAERAAHAGGIIEDGSIPPTDDAIPAATAVATRSRIWSAPRRPRCSRALDIADARGRGGVLSPAHAGRPALAARRRALSAAARVLRRPGSPMELAAEIDRGDVWYDFPFDAARRAPAAAARALPVVHAVREVARRAGAAGELADHRRRLALRAGVGRPGVLSLQRVGRRAARLAAHRRRAGLDPAAGVAARLDGEGEKGQRRVREGDQLRRDRPRLSVGLRAGGGDPRADAQGRVGHTYFDNGIRTHGSFDYTSLRGRFSHGCHRLYNNQAVRMFSFVLGAPPRQDAGLDRARFSPDLLVEGRGLRDAAAEPRLLLRAGSAAAGRDAGGTHQGRSGRSRSPAICASRASSIRATGRRRSRTRPRARRAAWSHRERARRRSCCALAVAALARATAAAPRTAGARHRRASTGERQQVHPHGSHLGR